MKAVALLAVFGASFGGSLWLLWPGSPPKEEDALRDLITLQARPATAESVQETVAELSAEAPPGRVENHGAVPSGGPATSSVGVVASRNVASAAGLDVLAALALQGDSVAVRIEAVHEVGERTGSRALEILEWALGDGAPGVRRAAVDALTVSPRPDAEPILQRALTHPDAAVRVLAAESLDLLRTANTSLARHDTPGL